MAEEQDLFAFENDENDDAKDAAKIRAERNRIGKKYREVEKALQAAQEQLTSYQSRERSTTLAERFTEAGVSQKHVKFFLAENPEVDPTSVTKESVLAYARENELPIKEAEAPAEGEGAGEGEGTTAAEGFQPKAPQGAGSANQGALNREAFLRLVQSDPAAAEAAFKAGKVDLSEVYKGLGPRV